MSNNSSARYYKKTKKGLKKSRLKDIRKSF